MGFFKDIGNAVAKPFKSVAKGAAKLVSDPGEWAQNVGKEIGKGASAIAPYAGKIPGVGSALAAPLAFGGSVLQGNNMKEHALNTAGAYLGGLAPGGTLGKSLVAGGKTLAGGGSLKDAAISGGLSAIAPSVQKFAGSTGIPNPMGGKIDVGGILNGALGGMPKTSGGIVPGPLPSTGGYAGGGGAGAILGGQSAAKQGASSGQAGGAPGASSGGSRYGAIGDFARDIFSGGKPLTLRNAAGGLGSTIGKGIDYVRDNPDTILAGAGIVSGALDMQKASNLRDQALKSATGAYNERAPLRSQAISGLQNTQRRDLSSYFRDEQNPYSAQVRPAASTPGPTGGSKRPGGGAIAPTADPGGLRQKAAAIKTAVTEQAIAPARSPVGVMRRGVTQALLDNPKIQGSRARRV